MSTTTGDKAADITQPPTSSTSSSPEEKSQEQKEFEELAMKVDELVSENIVKYKKTDWRDFSVAGRSHVANEIARNLIFKSVVERFTKDNHTLRKVPPIGLDLISLDMVFKWICNWRKNVQPMLENHL